MAKKKSGSKGPTKFLWVAKAFKHPDGKITQAKKGPQPAGVERGFFGEDQKWYTKIIPGTTTQKSWDVIQKRIQGIPTTKKGKTPLRVKAASAPTKPASVNDSLSEEFSDFIVGKIKEKYGVSIPASDKARQQAQTIYARLKAIEKDREAALEELKALK